MTGPFDTAALRQASEMPWPTEFREQSRLWAQNSSDLAAAADYIVELEVLRDAAEWLVANRGRRGEQQAWKLLVDALAKEDA